MNPKLLVVVLIVLVLLFLLAVGVGATRSSGAVDLTPQPWVDALGQRLAKQAQLEAADISAAIPASCRQALEQKVFVLPQGSMCSLFVKESSAPVRTLQLRAAPGNVARVEFHPSPSDQKRLTVQKALQGQGKDLEVKVQAFEAGGRLVIACVLGSCRIAVP